MSDYLTKTVEFELEGAELELDVEWLWFYDPGCTTGRYEDNYPPECECEVVPPKDLDELIKKFALEVMVPRWIKAVQDQCQDLEFDQQPQEWAWQLAQDREDWEADNAD